MTRCVFLFGPHIQQHDLARAHAARQFVRCHRFEAVAVAEEVTYHTVHLGEADLGGMTQSQYQADDFRTGWLIVHEQTVAAGSDELGVPQLLLMTRSIGNR